MSATKKPLTFDVERAPVLSPPPSPMPARPTKAPVEERKQVGARIKADTYRKLKARAAMEGVMVGDLLERAVDDFLAKPTA
jgi:hypothetical protein